MRNNKSLLLLAGFCLSLANNSFADFKSVRWTENTDRNSDFNHVVEAISQQTNSQFQTTQFELRENRELATSQYKRYVQVVEGVPVARTSIRHWLDKSDNHTIQLEAQVMSPTEMHQLAVSVSKLGGAKAILENFSFDESVRLSRQAISNTEDRNIKKITMNDQWESGQLVRVVKLNARRGQHQVRINAVNKSVIGTTYNEYPQADETSFQAMVFPIYEQVENSSEILQPELAELKYIQNRVVRANGDPFASLRDRQYLENQFDPLFGNTPTGIANGLWNMAYVRARVAEAVMGLPVVDNNFENGLVLEGRYATISLHAAVPQAFQGIEFPLEYSAHFRPDWRETLVNGEPTYEMVPTASIRGKSIHSADEVLSRLPVRDPNHNPVTYINQGFDELQVYYAVNTMFDSLRPMGFTDPDLSERPFHAFLYDPDISMRDNAYYTDDTINFTTYSPGNQNMARDNPTIWHELGHGVMDRMMGEVQLADTGGLSEGMADFVAQLVIQAATRGQNFLGSQEMRIINKTGFYLTNEVHDDGEAYGGAMNDLLTAAMNTEGLTGLHKVTDLIMEAMRLCRDNPALSASDWFGHILFADQRGAPGVRRPGEMRELILAALAGRNFPVDDSPVASLTLKNQTRNEDVTSTSPGSRGRPIPNLLSDNDKATFDLTAQVTNSNHYSFKFPVTVQVNLNGGPIQGAIHWDAEEQYPKTYVLNSPDDVAQIKLAATATCDYANRDDGSCVDFAYIKVFNDGEEKPVAKKRFYLRIKKQ